MEFSMILVIVVVVVLLLIITILVNKKASKNTNGGLTPLQYKVLSCICDVAIHSSPPPQNLWSNSNPKLLDMFFARKASDLNVVDAFWRSITNYQSVEKQNELKTALNILGTPTLCYLITDHFTPFQKLSPETQTLVIVGLASSKLLLRRKVYRAFVPLVYKVFFSTLDKKLLNPNWEAINYSVPPIVPESNSQQKRLHIMDQISSDSTLSCDAVVIGSGAGGGVVAALLAKAGHKVLVLEKGQYKQGDDFTWRESESAPLFEGGGLGTSEDLGVNVIAGSAVGGGTAINWSASFRTPDFILEEWRKIAPELFDEEGYNIALDQVCERLGVHTNSYVNKMNGILASGCQKMGYHNANIPRNTRGCEDPESKNAEKLAECGYCSMGCRSGAKQSTMATWLQDACQNRAVIIPNCYAKKVIIEKGKATGVLATVKDPRTLQEHSIKIKSKIVVSSCGALHTPALLMRSGLKNPHIGKNLYLHPVSIVAGWFNEKIEAWKGPIMTKYSSEFVNLDGKNHGVIHETPSSHPSFTASLTSMNSYLFGQGIKEFLLRSDKMSPIIALARDIQGGSITLDANGNPLINYKLGIKDWEHLKVGIESAVKMLAAAGCTEFLYFSGEQKPVIIPEEEVSKTNSKFTAPSVENYLQELRQKKYRTSQDVVCSAHQMGTCRVGTSPSNSAVNQSGKLWEVNNLYVADASTFPTALGINPMITVESVAYRIGLKICEELNDMNTKRYES
eukprot:TRINITY_DN11851_c0_g2_i1.p1 TRINITY_DN11851_c0_g2~~TRINITY_DN11851_c0_g2_i1.p1  ORF type:complete len:736 (+),score=117.23 TRINITY_DN11851_c0_g2_i1:383-2590(+)